MFYLFRIQLAFPSNHLRTLIDLQVDGSGGACVHLVIFIKMSWRSITLTLIALWLAGYFFSLGKLGNHKASFLCYKKSVQAGKAY